ncbi:hypothetical protein [Streptomyces sp. NPDC060001]|uniref:hypothetical protein n=1 Tax=Streptomyces sp. NPDC060001 TaxID=3347032 RepID=UPI00367CC660
MTGRDVAHAPSLTKDQVILLQAHHEAAHAVVAHHAGMQVNSLHVRQSGDAAGWWIEGITYVVHHARQATPLALQGAAGEIAALKWLDNHGLRTAETEAAANADHDRDDVTAILAEDGITVDWPSICDAARNEVNVFWPQITAVAHAAAEQGDLTAEQITDLIRGSVDIHCFRYQHGGPDSWSTADFETYEHLAEINDQNAPTTSAYQPAA